MTAQEFCKLYNLTMDQFYGKTKIEGNLYRRNITHIPEGFNPIVGGNLDLGGLTEIPSSFNPTVGGFLLLNSLTSIPSGFNPIVGGSLYLNNVTSIPKGFKPIVGDSLNLGILTSIPEGFNPIVGGDLELYSVTEIPKGFNPIAGGSVYTKLKNVNYTVLPENYVFEWQDGKYIKIDGIFCEVLKKHKDVWKVKKLNSTKEFYIVSKDGKYAHGNSIKEAKESILYKITSRDKSKYKNLNFNSILKLGEMIECYRVITGACEFGVKDFITKVLNGNLKKQYTINEIITITYNHYGHQTFKEFFK